MKKLIVSMLLAALVIMPISASAETTDIETGKMYVIKHYERCRDAVRKKEQKKNEKRIKKEPAATITAKQFKRAGIVYYEGYKWTWYSQRVLSGGGLDIPDRHVDENGYICDKDNYICLASSELDKGTVLKTPFGKNGKIYDCGCDKGTIDTYTNW